MMKVLLVGGSGLIGYYLLPDLVRAGHDVTVISRGNRPFNTYGITHVRGERNMLFSSQGVLGKFDVVIDNVAYTPEDCRTLLESMRGRMDHYIVTSTAFVYPNVDAVVSRPSRPFTEADALFDNPLSDECSTDDHDKYVYNKKRMEHWLRHHGQAFDIKITVIRPFFQIVGPNTEDGRFAWFWLRVKDGGQIWLPDDLRHEAGRCQVSFAGDVAQVILAALSSAPHDYNVYNIAQPELWTCEEYIREMGVVAGTNPEIRFAPRSVLNEWAKGTYRLPAPYSAILDITKAKLELSVSYTPMDQWIRETGDWMTQFYQDFTPDWYATRKAELVWG